MAAVARKRRTVAAPTILGREFDAAYRAGMATAKRDGWTARIRNPSDHIALAHGCWYDHAAALRVEEFFADVLRHSQGQWAGTPITLQPWQQDDLIYPLFGWKRADGTRRFRVGFVFIPKKNGKSLCLSAIGLYMLVADNEPGAEVYAAAASREQAKIVYGESESMVAASPDLSEVIDLVPSKKSMTFANTRSRYEVLSSESYTAEGKNIHCLLFDELHAQPDRALWDALRYGGKARRQPLLLSITTAGQERDSVCYEQYEYSKKVLNGESADYSHFACIYEAGPRDKWDKPATWRKANPSLGVIITEESFRLECEEAKTSLAKQSAFRRYGLNQWVEIPERAAVSITDWDAGAGQRPDDPRPRCYAGLDLSDTTDTTSLVVFAPEYKTRDGDDGKPVHTLIGGFAHAYIWIPGDRMADRQTRDGVPFAMWRESGFVRVCEGKVIDFEMIRDQITSEIAAQWEIVECGYDPYNARAFTQGLGTRGMALTEITQNYKGMSGATKTLIRLISSRKIRHDGNPAFRWTVSNAAVVTDPAGNMMPDKRKRNKRIDPFVSLAMAVHRAEGSGPPAAKTSVYETRGVEVW